MPKKYLVIVESPAKAKTINKYLGSNYKVVASNGHLRDLPKSQLGVDIENDFEPRYITIRGKGSLLTALKSQAKSADKIYLATDPDREGEAISWHLAAALGVSEEKTYRITFNEITKSAVKAAIESPRKIDQSLVDAQQARRVLDRIIGYQISPILWKKIKKGLSAGRVQSIATRLIVERDKEIEAFIPQEFWNIYAYLSSGKETFTATFYGKDKKMELPDEATVKKVVSDLKGAKFVVNSVKVGTRERRPYPPFITSTLQQDASNKLNFTSKRTMALAQRLYEGVSVPGEGNVGLITYMRTDSLRISEEARTASVSFIKARYGSEYLPKTPHIYKAKKAAQDAHEAIRPTNVDLTPDAVKDALEPAMYKLYKLIWERFVASNMSSAVYDTVSAEIGANGYIFKASGSKLKFAGFLKVYADKKNKDEKESTMPVVEKGEALTLKKLEEKQSFTQPPPHFTEASLIKLLEEDGIGRPSTYSPTIATILARGYVVRDGKSLLATELGGIVTDLMKNHFTDIVDTDFTVNMENRLDTIEEGDVDWVEVIRQFYPAFKSNLETAEKAVEKIQLKDEESDIECDKCGRMMVYKLSKFGKFLACPGFPDCRNTQTIIVETGVNCPSCSARILERKSRKGKVFYGCEKYPECEFMLWDHPVDEKCGKCESLKVKKYGKTVCSNKECDESKVKKK